MPGTGRGEPDAALVTAAREGDQRALDALVAGSLPLVYNIVGRALNGHNDVDDVVQETLLRVVHGLSGLRDPGAYRSWLVAITVRQVRDHERDRRTTQHRREDLDSADEVADPASDFAAVTILRLGLTDQRREVAEATRWLDREDQGLLALWWLEETGELDRADLAKALGLSHRHTAVRVQRMKEQIHTSRTVVRALQADPRCPDLRTLAWSWDGVPSPLWRKRFARHVRDCAVCGRRTAGMLPIDRLLSGLPLLPLPAGYLLDHLPAAHALAVPPPRGLLSSLTQNPVAGKAAVAGVITVVTGAVVAGQLTGPNEPPVPRTAPRMTASPSEPSPSTRRETSPAPTAGPTPVRVKRSATAAPRPASAKKGVSVWEMPGAGKALAKSGARWYYTWSTAPEGPGVPEGVEFVPMIWGAGSVTDANLARARSAGPYLLAFNEPDLPQQANMTVEQALDLWPRLMKAGKVLGSPGVAFGGATPNGWLDRFMKGAAERDYRVDFVTLHWYGADFRTEAAVRQLKTYLQAVHKRYRKPIWLTEYALIDFSNGTRYAGDAEQAAFITASTKMLASLPYVQRYAWFGLPSEDGKQGSGLFRGDGRATKAGRAFQEAR
ncbi:sigma-70 family RNA polymerase sigma factor [Nonomuraea jiangxiensis]|uniref:RNA polymerase sigma factor, sigma-70 family n=1 Tax=Nonomuraea jiangxiensis TaxID=633440 RepID=A0A1G9IRG4_9ACTN|nr:sigma-70 family RNA polymerase sigma factor [Nonomuraea jiangxiensis]SDL27655.1 RNA polymerase sigma factor, sigma-70 family [Nonomuraea jiangxiensis]